MQGVSATVSEPQERAVPLAVGRVAATLDASVIGLLVAAVTFAGSWIPSYSFDETITMSLIHRTPGQLAQVLPNIDAVHGLYYFLVQAWVDAFGDSRAATRLLSSLAVGLAAALTTLLARRLSTRLVAVVSGLAVVIIPRGEWAGTEARSYAFTMVAFALSLLLLVIALRRSNRGWWVAYGAAVALSCSLFAYLVFLPIANVVSVLLVRQWRRMWVAVSIAGVAGAVAASPVLLFASRQKGQVSWIPPLSAQTWEEVFVEQWFLDSRKLAVACAFLLLAGVCAYVVRWRRGRPPESGWQVTSFAWPQMVVCTTGVLLLSSVVSPLYVPRYLTSATPAVALLVGFAVGSLIPQAANGRFGWLRWTTAVLITSVLSLLAVGSYLENRAPYANKSDYSQAADWVGSHARPGDAIVYAQPGYPFSLHVVEYANFAAFRNVDDIMQETTPIQQKSYWGKSYPFADLSKHVGGHSRVIVVANATPAFEQTDIYRALAQLGYRPISRWAGPYSSVVITARP